MTSQSNDGPLQPYKEALEALPLEDLEATHGVAWRVYELEAGRADQVEKKGNYVLGFSGLTVSFFGGAAITAAKSSPWWVLSGMGLTLAVLFVAVWHAYQTVRSRMYMLPQENAVLKVPLGKDQMLREHTLDVLETTHFNRQVTNQRGGHLKWAERLLTLGLALLFASLLASLLTAAFMPPSPPTSTPVPVPAPTTTPSSSGGDTPPSQPAPSGNQGRSRAGEGERDSGAPPEGVAARPGHDLIEAPGPSSP